MEFNLQPTFLQNELIELFPLHESDFEALYAVAADPLVWEQHPNPIRYQREVFLAFFEDAIASKGAFMIKAFPSNEVVGSSGFFDFNSESN